MATSARIQMLIVHILPLSMQLEYIVIVHLSIAETESTHSNIYYLNISASDKHASVV